MFSERFLDDYPAGMRSSIAAKELSLLSLLSTQATQATQPHLHKLHFNLGYILQQQAEPEQAADHYRRAILLSRQAGDAQSGADAHHNLGVVLAQQERWLAAIYHYRRSIALGQRSAFCNLGTALLQQGETAAAIEVYQQALSLAGHFDRASEASLHHNLAQALQKQRRLPEAIAAYREALAIDATKAQVHYNLGRACLEQGNRTEAIACFEQALRLDASLTVAQADCAVAWLTLGQIDRALQQFQQAIAPDRAFIAAYCDWIQALSAADEFTQARRACAQFLITLPQNRSEAAQLLVQALTHWGNVLMEYGGDSQLRSAERLYQYALQIEPQQIERYRRLAQCLGKQQRFATAIVTCHLALAIAPQDSSIYAELAHLLQQQQQWPRSLHYYRQAIRLRKGESIEAVDRSIPSTPTDCPPEAVKSCEGLNCESCLTRMTQRFEPVRLAEGIYQLAARSPAPITDTPIDRAVTSIANGRIWVAPQISTWQACSAIAVFDADDQLMPQLSRSYPGQLPNCQHSEVPLQGVPAQDQLPPPLQLNGKVAALSSLSGSVYFHWMIDLLPRLEILQRQINFDQIDYFLVNSTERSFQRETLQAFGIHADRVIESDRHPHVQAEHLIVPEFSGDLGWVEPGAIEFLRNKFLSKNLFNSQPNFTASGYSKQKKLSRSREVDALSSSEDFAFIYLSRSDASYRRLLNEDQVMDYLRSLGFVSLTLDSIPVTEQAALFANAKVIVAPHGSSLTNLVFCSPETSVVELISPHYLRHYFWRISRSLSLEHYVVWGEAVSCQFVRRLMYPNPLLEDIWIDIDRLHSVMQKVLDQSAPC